MALTTPWYTSDQLISSIKRKILFPASQVTFLDLDILAFANEEMFISQVPSVLQYHEEYFVSYKILPLTPNISRYPIPDRAVGMKLRDVFWQDQNGNLFEMTRINEHDKAFFQANAGSNQAIHKFYLEGNDVVVTPGVVDSPTGSLVMVFYLRPNQLVKNAKSANITSFNQLITINSSLINALDTFSIAYGQTISAFPDFGFNNLSYTKQFTNIIPFTAVNSLGGTITSITNYSGNYVLVAAASHQLSDNQTVTITGSNSNPSINGTWPVQVIDANSFIIPTQIGVAGTTGTFSSVNQFLIGSSDAQTAANLSAAINASGLILNSGASGATVTLSYANINTNFITSNTVGFLIPQTTIGITFNALPSQYTDNETNMMEPLFVNNTLIDFLQTKPGHRTYVYDVRIPTNGISGSTIVLPIKSLLVPTGTVNNSAGSTNTLDDNSVQYTIANLQIGDYICLANECIIPQIPPDLHNGLAERVGARILAAIGDQAGLQSSNAKIAEIEQRQGNLLDNRSEGTPQKVTGRHSLLRYGKMGIIRRV